MYRFLLVMFFGLANFSISYASFPIKNQIINSLDTSKSENIDEYHSNLIKMGFDISSCKCKECRENPKNFVFKKSENSKNYFTISAILFVITLTIFVIWLLDGVACINSANTCSSNNTNIILYIASLVIFGYTSIFYFLRGLIHSKKNN
tara:strand:+ start:383 stop:829 length:447 start_codon:yes stop_codon:yes gene_type:complete